MKSILQDEKKCYITGSTIGLHEHHIFGGPNRSLSEKYGLKVWLSWDYHIADSPNRTPHNDPEIDLWLKRIAQRKFEETHSRQEFMLRFGRNYLDDICADCGYFKCLRNNKGDEATYCDYADTSVCEDDEACEHFITKARLKEKEQWY